MTNPNLTDRSKESHNDLLVSYKTLRNFIGFSGILLPIMLIVFTTRAENDLVIQGSISDYYYTSAGDIFVIVICILSGFLITYKGYQTFEKVLLFTAAVCGFGLTLFPTKFKNTLSVDGVHIKREEVTLLFDKVELHWVFAGLFFICLSLISILFFTKSSDQTKLVEKDAGKITQKSWRNMVYVSMGYLMLACIGFIVVYSSVSSVKLFFGDLSMIFILETVAVFAFGVSWITKGETLFPDGEHYVTKGLKKAMKSD